MNLKEWKIGFRALEFNPETAILISKEKIGHLTKSIYKDHNNIFGYTFINEKGLKRISFIKE